MVERLLQENFYKDQKKRTWQYDGLREIFMMYYDNVLAGT